MFYKNEELAKYDVKIEKVWKDKKRYFGLPISFTWYSLSKDRLFLKKGLFFEKNQETLLYRIRDLTVQKTFLQTIFGTGTIVVHTLDPASPYINIVSVKKPEAVKEMLHAYCEEAKKSATFEQILG